MAFTVAAMLLAAVPVPTIAKRIIFLPFQSAACPGAEGFCESDVCGEKLLLMSESQALRSSQFILFVWKAAAKVDFLSTSNR
jgi:hypothetical protein